MATFTHEGDTVYVDAETWAKIEAEKNNKNRRKRGKKDGNMASLLEFNERLKKQGIEAPDTGRDRALPNGDR